MYSVYDDERNCGLIFLFRGQTTQTNVKETRAECLKLGGGGRWREVEAVIRLSSGHVLCLVMVIPHVIL